MNHKINWGIIGLGNMANVFISCLKELKTTNLKAISSRNKEKLKCFSNELSINKTYCFDNYSDLIRCEDIDAVYLTLPNNFHYAYVLEALSHGKHVLVEKPGFVSKSNAREIERVLKGKDLILCEGFMYLHHPRTEFILNLLENERIGDILKVNAKIGYCILPEYNLISKILDRFRTQNRLFNRNMGGGCIFDLGCYLTSFLQLISIENSFVFSHKKISNEFKKVEVNATATILCSKNTEYEFHCSFNKHLDQDVEIIGSDGKITLSNSWNCMDSSYKINDSIKRSHTTFDNPFSQQIESINNCILEKNFTFTGFPYSRFSSLLNTSLLDSWRKN
jgi:predicted dehydrogenase